MALQIDSAEAEFLAHELAKATGESVAEAVTVALRERLATMRSRIRRDLLHTDVAKIQAFVASLPERDTRTEDEILGYDEFGLPR